MLNKIILIRPHNVYHYNNYPPLSLICVGSRLKAAGYNVKIINCVLEKDSFKTIDKESKNALFVGISLLTSEAPDAYRIMKYIKENSDIPIVVGGAHCTLFPEQMADCKYVDFVVAGEGEEHILKVADLIKNGVRGEKIFYKKILDMETLPLPDYSLDENIENFITNFLTDKFVERVKQQVRWLPYQSSRGCPSFCTFCINTVTNNTCYRKKSAEKVIDEIEYIVRKYRISHLKIIDDNFFVDIKRVRKICDGIVKKELNITWDAECRCDYFNDHMLNDETLALARKSGLIQLTLGLESGSLRALKIMKKGITPEQGEYAVKRCNEYGITARSSFMIETPGESLSDIQETIAFVNRLRRYSYFTCGVGTFRPYPKCELTKKLIEEGYLAEPADFKSWTDRSVIDMYTAGEYIRPWQVNGRYSESAANYLNMESMVRLGNYQIDNAIDRLTNTLFMVVAKIRNRFHFYRFPIDKDLYQQFIKGFYRKRQNSERDGASPLAHSNREGIRL